MELGTGCLGEGKGRGEVEEADNDDTSGACFDDG